MDEVAEPASHTPLAAIQSTTRFSEICHRRKFAVYGSRGVPAGVECVARCLGVFFVFESRVDVTDQVWMC